MGIGTSTPGEKLTVNGNVLAKEVIVDPGRLPDYVFEESYDLPTLDEVSSFIEKKGHLPDVPSAEEVEKNGLRLGEMDATLLRKVEELTLYAIEQKRRADRQAATLDSMRQANARLQRESKARQNQMDNLRSRLEAERRRNDRQAARIEKLQAQLQQLLRHERE